MRLNSNILASRSPKNSFFNTRQRVDKENILESNLLNKNKSVSNIPSMYSPKYINTRSLLNQEGYHIDLKRQNRERELVVEMEKISANKLSNQVMFKQRIKTLQTRIQQLSTHEQTCKKLISQNSSLKSKLSQISTINNTLTNKSYTIQQTNTNLSRQLSILQINFGSKIDNLTQRIECLYYSQDELTQNNEILKVKNEQIQVQLYKGRKINEMLKDIIRKYQDNYTEKGKQLEVINKKYAYLLGEYQRMEKRVNLSRQYQDDNRTRRSISQIEEFTQKLSRNKSTKSLRQSNPILNVTNNRVNIITSPKNSKNKSQIRFENNLQEIQNLEEVNIQLHQKILGMTSKQQQYYMENNLGDYAQMKLQPDHQFTSEHIAINKENVLFQWKALDMQDNRKNKEISAKIRSMGHFKLN